MNERTLTRFGLKWLLLSATILLFALAGCRSHRNAIKPQTEPSFLTWQRLSMPVKVSIESPLQFSISGQATFQRDSTILLSFRMLGFEVVAIQIDKDSALIVDKYHKYFIKIPTDRLLGETGISTADIQDLLIGRMPTFEIPSGVKGYSIDVSEESGILHSISIKAPAHDRFTIDYGSPLATDHGYIAGELHAKGSLSGSPFSALIKWSPSSAKWDDDVSLRKISVGRGYKEIDPDNFRNMFSGVGQFQ